MTTSDTQQAVLTPSPRLAELDFFRGTWDAEGTFHATPFSAFKPIRMTIEVVSAHRGFWLQFTTAELADDANPNPLSATYIWGYDPAAGHYLARWFDSNGGRATQTSIGWHNETLVFEGEMTNAGFTFQLRDTFTRNAEDEYYHLGEVNLGEGWIPVDEETAKRRTS